MFRIFFILFVFLLNNFLILGWELQKSEKLADQNCAVLFTKENFSGDKFDIKYGESYSDLSEYFINPSEQILHSAFGQQDFKSWNNLTKSIRVNSYCILSVYEDPYYEGELVLLKNDHRVWNRQIGAVSCDCAMASTSTSANQNRTHENLELILNPIELEMPGDVRSIARLGKSLGSELSNSHVGIAAAIESAKNGKSPKNAYVILLGLKGSGKTSTLNFLLNDALKSGLMSRSDQDASTYEIQEFRFPVPLTNLGIANSELRVIDTPGFFSTTGFDKDSQILGTLDNYLNNHEELRNRTPNVVMIFANFNHNNLIGPGARFVNMLRELHLFNSKIFAQKYSNVVIVLTRFMDEKESPLSLQQNPKVRIQEFQSAIRLYSLLPKPITVVVAENKPRRELRMNNGFFKLPNGELYPKNLIERILIATENGGDPIGSAIFKSAFENPGNLNLSNLIRFPLMDRRYTNNYYDFLNRLHDKGISDTEISKLLRKTYQEIVNSKQGSMDSTLLSYLHGFFNARQIFTKEDLPKTNLETIKNFQELRKTPEIIEIVLKAFPELKFPEFDAANLLPGKGYDIFLDKVAPYSPFRSNSTRSKLSELGFLLPNFMSFKIENSAVDLHQTFSNYSDYYKNRLRNLGVSEKIYESQNVFSEALLYKPVRIAGSTILRNSDDDPRGVIAAREFRLFELMLQNDSNYISLNDLSSTFVNQVNSLPSFNSNDKNSLKSWTQFFTMYGTHVIKTVFGGGVIELTAREGKLNNSTTSAQDLFKTFDTNVPSLSESGIDFAFRGGDFKFHTKDLSKFSIAEAEKLLENWKKSLASQPVMLPSTIKLIPMSEIAKTISSSAHAKILEGETLFFNLKTNEL